MTFKQLSAYLLTFLVTSLAIVQQGCGVPSITNYTNYQNIVVANLGPMVNSKYDDYATDLHDDRLLFTSNRPTVEGYIQGDDFWFSDREANLWSQALNLGGAINTDSDEGSPYITPDGQSVFFVQCWSEDGLGDGDIYTASFNYKGTWQSVQNLGERVNTKYWDSHPYLSPDGTELYFASNRPGGRGGTDIWVSKRMRSGQWGAAKNLGPEINTSGDEKSPLIAPNGTDLFFASNGHPGLGGSDIFLSKNLGRKGWSAPVNIGKPFNTAAEEIFLRLSTEEDTVFISSTREGGNGGFDIYSFAPNPFKDTTRYIYYLAGVVYDTATTLGIENAVLEIKSVGYDSQTLPPLKGGRYKIKTNLGQSFELKASAPGYTTESTSVAVPTHLSFNEYRKSIGLALLPKNAEESPTANPKDHPIVYFDFDRAEITTQTAHALDILLTEKIKPLLDYKTTFEIRLDAYTDDYGSEEYNINLSRRRGAAVSKYLSSHGVPRSTILINAYGELQPTATNLTPEGRQENRRVEIQLNSSPAP